MKKIFTGVILLLLIISFISCNSCKNRASEKQLKEVEKEQKGIIEEKIQENVYPIPTSAEVIRMLTDLEVGYQIGLTNSVENTKNISAVQRGRSILAFMERISVM